VVELNTQDEALMVHAFVRGVLSGPFGDSLIGSRPRTFGEIKSGFTNIIYPISYSKAPQQQQTHPTFHQTQRI